jgi:hypothetical protein
MEYSQLKKGLQNTETIKLPEEFQTNCDCLPLCSDLSYVVQTSQTNMNWNEWMVAHRRLGRFHKYFVKINIQLKIIFEF